VRPARRANALQLFLDCTAKAEKELPWAAGAGAEQPPPEAEVMAAAEVRTTVPSA
jgi:hypothetical protein